MDSEFSSDFASSLLNWDDNEAVDEGSAPPSESAKTIKQDGLATLPATVSQVVQPVHAPQTAEYATAFAPLPSFVPVTNPATQGNHPAVINGPAAIVNQPRIQIATAPQTAQLHQTTAATATRYTSLAAAQQLRHNSMYATAVPQTILTAPMAQQTQPTVAGLTAMQAQLVKTNAPAPIGTVPQMKSSIPPSNANAPASVHAVAAPLPTTTAQSTSNQVPAPSPGPNVAALKAPQLHPLGIQSSATCPPHAPGTLPTVQVAAAPQAQFLPFVYNPLLQSSTAVAANSHLLALAVQQQQQQPPLPQAAVQPQIAAQSKVPVASASSAPPSAAPPVEAHSVPMTVNTPMTVAGTASIPAPAPDTANAAPATNTNNQTGSIAAAAAAAATPAAPAATAANPAAATGRPNATATSTADGKSMPPFYLFDAPVELRHNFLQCQRMHGLPITQDSNSFHYGMAVNGFHPQLNAQVNPIVPNAVQLIDARSKKKKGRERNEREQKRAAKITELIEKLRLGMEKGGWKVEVKSKYHTLSTCADYVKHLMKTTRDKEEAVKKAKTELEMKERKLEEDKNQESRSDPESVASSLTANTSDSSPTDENPEARRKRKSSKKNKDGKDHQPQAKKAKVAESSGSSADNSSEEGSGGPGVQNISLDKMSSSISEMTDSNRGSSGESADDKRSNRKNGDKRSNHSDDDTSAAVPSSSSISSTAAVARGAGSEDREHGHADVVIKVKKQKKKESKEEQKNKEFSSLDTDFTMDYEEIFVSSNIPQLIATPAGRIVACNDFFVKATGLSKEEIQRLTIFSIVQSDKLSNLFELVAEALRGSGQARKPTDGRTARQDPKPGKSVSSNSSGNGSGNESGSNGGNGSGNESGSSGETGSNRNDSGSNGNSSGDKTNLISSRSSNETGSNSSSSGHTSGGSGNSNEGISSNAMFHKQWNYAAMTLPCVAFPGSGRDGRSKASRQLYMTVTLMPDEDPRKRCFHCVITDCPGTNGALGFITPELLSILFSDGSDHPGEINQTAESENKKDDGYLSEIQDAS